MIEYVAFDVLNGGDRWARVFIRRADGKTSLREVGKRSAFRLLWTIEDMTAAGIGKVHPSSLGWYWRRS